LAALGAAHASEILHRDLKPENILITAAEDGSEIVKLVDFGVAKAGAILNADDSNEGITLVKTRVGTFVGTPRYAAPEMVVGDPCGPPADLFCVGLIVYEALTGEPLLQGESHRDFMNALVFPRPFDLQGVTEDWRDWLGPILEKSPDRRTQSAQQALDHLEELFPVPDKENPFPLSNARFDTADPDDKVLETSPWSALDIDYDALQENRLRAKEDALRHREANASRRSESPDEKIRQPPPEADDNTLLVYTVVALLLFVLFLGAYILFSG
jgi:serine/threonine protein kinase